MSLSDPSTLIFCFTQILQLPWPSLWLSPYHNKLECLALPFTSTPYLWRRLGAYHKSGPRSSILVGSSLHHKYKTKMEVNDSHKHSSLLWYGNNYGLKTLIVQGNNLILGGKSTSVGIEWSLIIDYTLVGSSLASKY